MTARANAQRTRSKIIESSRRLLEASSTVPAADLAAAAGVSRSTLYRHFPDRDSLLEAVRQHRPRASTESIEQPLPPGRLERRTQQTVTTRDALAAELSVVRRQRFATTVDELETGLSAIAAPVEGRDGVFAALGVSGPTARLQDRVDHIGRLLIEQADALSALLRRRTRPGSDRSKEGVA